MKFDLSSFSFVELRGRINVRNVISFVNIRENVLSTIVSPAHRQKKDVDTERLRERQCNRNGSSLPSQVRGLLIDQLHHSPTDISKKVPG